MPTQQSTDRSLDPPHPGRLRVVTARSWTLAGVGLLVLLTTAAYIPSLNGGFIIDDDVLLTDSPLIKSPDGVYSFWCTAEPVDYWPVSNTSLWLEWRLWRMDPTGYHATNLILHLIESLLIWSILQQLSIPGAFLGALLFALHPVNVQSVAWIAQRKTLLAMLFSLLSVVCHLKSEAQSARSDRSSAVADGWYWLGLAAFTLAMLSKISAAILAPMLLGIVAWLRPLTRRDFARAVPFFLMAAVLVGVNLWFRTRSGAIAQPTGTALERVLAAAGSVWFYLYKALLPIDLAYTYPVSHNHADRLAAWVPLIATVVATLVLWRYRRGRSRALLFAWGFYCVALMPATGLTEKLVIADRYQHVALIGLMALVACGWDTARQRAHPSTRKLLYAAAVLMTGAYAALTWRQSGLYSDSVTLMQTAVDTYPSSALAHHNVGFALLKAGRLPEAKEHLEYALRIEPDYIDAHKTLAATLSEAGQPREAIPHFLAVLRLVPDDPSASYDMGAALREAGRPEEAIEYLQRALQSQPNFAAAHRSLGKALLGVGRPAQAIEQFEQALRIDPDDAEARHHLETALTLK